MIEGVAGPPPKRRVWPAFVAFVLLLVGALVAQLGVALVLVALHAREVLPKLKAPGSLGPVLTGLMTHGSGLVLTVAGTSACVISAALVAALLTGPSLRVRLRWGPSNLSPAQIAFGTVGLLAMGQALEGLASHVNVPSATLSALADASHAPLPVFVPLFIVGTLGAAFGEESFFRGYMGSVLGEAWPRWANVLATSVCFGLIHGDPVHSPLAFCIGLYLGFIAERARSIRPTMFIHFVNNAVSFTQSRYGGLVPDEGSALSIGIALVIAGACLWPLREPRPAVAVSPG